MDLAWTHSSCCSLALLPACVALIRDGVSICTFQTIAWLAAHCTAVADEAHALSFALRGTFFTPIAHMLVRTKVRNSSWLH